MGGRASATLLVMMARKMRHSEWTRAGRKQKRKHDGVECVRSQAAKVSRLVDQHNARELEVATPDPGPASFEEGASQRAAD